MIVGVDGLMIVGVNGLVGDMGKLIVGVDG